MHVSSSFERISVCRKIREDSVDRVGEERWPKVVWLLYIRKRT
jgi:hypothetical protein